MDSAMDSTIPPTIPTSLAASFSVTMMSSTASFISCAASTIASWVWEAYERWEMTSADNDRIITEFLWISNVESWVHQHAADLRVPAALLGSVEHLQSRLRQGLGLIQKSHLLLVVPQLRRHSNRGVDQGLEVTSQLGHLSTTTEMWKRIKNGWLLMGGTSRK